MGIHLFNVPARTTRNEMTANLDRKKNGYKMSRKAKALLGIGEDESSRLAIAGDDQNRILIKAVTADEPNNATVSKLNMINHNGIVSKLDTFGNHFEITEEVTSEGYYVMQPSETESEEETTTEEGDTEPTDAISKGAGTNISIEDSEAEETSFE